MTVTVDSEVPQQRSASADEEGRFLTFILNGEMYALDILEVTEIIEYRSMTVVPMMPDFIRGVINLRGRVLPVLDLAARFQQGACQVGRRTAIVVVEVPADGPGPAVGVGIMVDSVHKVIHLRQSDVQDPPAFGAGVHSDFIQAMARQDDNFVVILRMSTLLDLHARRVIEEAMHTGESAAAVAEISEDRAVGAI